MPLLARAIIDFEKWQDPAHGRETWLRRTHARSLHLLSARPVLAGLAVLVLIGVGYFAYRHVGTGFLPRMDEGGFVLDYQTAPGTSLTETDRELRQVKAILKNDPNVYTFSRRSGAELGGDLIESYQGDFFVRLVAASRRPPIWTVMDDITEKITREVPGVTFDTHELLDDMIGDMVGHRQPIVVELSAKTPNLLAGTARKIAAAIAKVPGIEPASINNRVVPAGDALEIHVDTAPRRQVRFAAGQPEITRDNLEQIVAVTAQISGDHDLGSTAAAVEAVVGEPGLLPDGVYYRIGGAYKQQQLAMRGMFKVFAAAATANSSCCCSSTKAFCCR